LPAGAHTFTLDDWMGADPNRDTPVREGDVLAGRYRVDRVLATGGMGIVVAARHMQLNQRVAVKVLTHNVGSSQAIARFLTEAKASALLRSDHVVHVSDVGTLESGQPFMVMELLEGEDLSQVLEQEGRLPIDRAVDYVLQASEGLTSRESFIGTSNQETSSERDVRMGARPSRCSTSASRRRSRKTSAPKAR
jgi:serine/threonine protein kinase